MEWQKWAESMYHWPTPETLRFLSSKEGYELALGLRELYSRTRPEAWAFALARATDTFDLWKVVVSASHYGVIPNIGLISRDTGLSERQVQDALDTVGMPAIIVASEFAGRAEYCRRACRDAPDFGSCFIECMKGGQQFGHVARGV